MEFLLFILVMLYKDIYTNVPLIFECWLFTYRRDTGFAILCFRNKARVMFFFIN